MNFKKNPLVLAAIGIFLTLIAVAAIFMVRNTGPFIQPQGAENQTIQTGTNTVQIKNFSFSPSTLTVKKGATVTFANSDSSAHTVTANDGSFDTGSINSGASQTITFSKTGTFTYYCSIHPTMKGTVVVQ